MPLQNSFQSVSPEMFRNPFLSVADYRFVANGPFRKRCNTVAKLLLRSVPAGFSLQIRFKPKVATDISE
jgi:hypothetical protein